MTHLIQFRVSDEQWQQIQDAATSDRRSVASWVRLLIEDRLREANATSDLPKDLVAVLEDRGVMIPRDLEVFSKMIYRPEDILPATTAGATHQASVSQQEENPKPGDERSNRSRRAKPKACKHTNQIRKLGAAFCTDCGEFV